MNRAAHRFYKWLGLVVAVLISGAGGILGLVEDVPLQHVIFYTAATFALVLWGWHHFSVRWIYEPDAIALDNSREGPGRDADQPAAPPREEPEPGTSYVRALLIRHRRTIVGIVILLLAYLGVGATVDGFFTVANVIASLILAALLALAVTFNRYVAENKSAFIGMTALIGLFIVGSIVVDGFFSTINMKSMLVFAAFLGLACLGQTLVVLLGGLDLSIPFIIGSANIGLMYLFGFEGLPNWIAVICILILGTLIGLVTGFLSFRLQGQALIVSLGVGFAVAGGTQIVTSIGTRYAGNVHGAVPGWLTNIAAMNGTTFGLSFPAHHPDLGRRSRSCSSSPCATPYTAAPCTRWAAAAPPPAACGSPSAATGSGSTRSAASSPP